MKPFERLIRLISNRKTRHRHRQRGDLSWDETFSPLICHRLQFDRQSRGELKVPSVQRERVAFNISIKRGGFSVTNVQTTTLRFKVQRKGENKPDVSSPPQYRFGEDKRPRVQDRDYTDSEASTFVQSRFNSAERSLFSTNGIHCNPEYSRYVALKCLNMRIETAECKVLFLRSIGERK